MLTIRIAILHHALGRFGGAEKMTILHSLYLRKMGFDVELFYNGPMHLDWRDRILSSMPLKILPFGLPSSVGGAGKIMRIMMHLKSFDIILVHHHICPFLAYYLAIFLKTKIIWYCGEPLRALWESWLSGMDYRELSCTVKPTSTEFYGKALTSVFLSNQLYDPSLSFIRSMDKASARLYTTIVTNSNYTRNMVRRTYDLEKPIPVIYPGVETGQNMEGVTNEELGDYILSVGAMIPMKNHSGLLKAFHSLPRQYRSRVKLLLIGSGPLENEIRSLVHKLDLNNVVFRSGVSEQSLCSYYANCSFVVHMALNEPFGCVPVEAAVHGKPSIVSNNGGTSEFIVHEENGLLVSPYDLHDIADSMECLLKDKELAEEMGLKAKAKALREFTIENSTENLAKAIRTHKNTA